MNSFGRFFRITTFGESHGCGIGVIIDGCPAGLKISTDFIQNQLDRRRPGQSSLTSPRKEPDKVQILSGLERNITTGAPIALYIANTDIKQTDYKQFENVPRPSHGDFTFRIKYGIMSSSGGGRYSARETAARVAAGAVAEILLKELFSIEIVAWTSQIGPLSADSSFEEEHITRKDVDLSPVRCPDKNVSDKMVSLIENVRNIGDSIGGIVTCKCTNVPAGLGDPVFYKLNALLAWAMMTIPAAKGFEIGSGFKSALMKGSEHNDIFIKKTDGKLGTAKNNSGGIQAGISNGEPIIFRVAFKPPATIAINQKTVDYDGNIVELEGKGRHDPCVVPRAIPIVEAMAAIVLADAAIANRGSKL